jgi:addiction module HigA family antidote
MVRKIKRLPPIHPGEILREEFLEPMGITAYRLAKDIKVPQTRIAAILGRGRAISADTALRLSRYFGMSESFWIDLQANYDIACAKDAHGAQIEREVKPRIAA